MTDEPERNVAPSDNDEGLIESSRHERESVSDPVEMWGGASHFHPYLANQRRYPSWPRGTARDAG